MTVDYKLLECCSTLLVTTSVVATMELAMFMSPGITEDTQQHIFQGGSDCKILGGSHRYILVALTFDSEVLVIFQSTNKAAWQVMCCAGFGQSLKFFQIRRVRLLWMKNTVIFSLQYCRGQDIKAGENSTSIHQLMFGNRAELNKKLIIKNKKPSE